MMNRASCIVRRALCMAVLVVGFGSAWADDPYVQTDGTQCFLTDRCASPRTKSVIDFVADDKDTVQQRFFGADADLDSVPFSFSLYISGNKKFAFSCKDGAGNWTEIAQAVDTTSRWTFTLDALGKKYDLRKTGAASATKSGTFTTTCTKTNTSVLAIAANNRDGEIMHYAKMKVYSFKVYDGNVLVRCYVPFWDSTRTGLFELLTKSFVAGSGTGDLVTGGDQPTDYSSYFAADDGWRWSTAHGCAQVRGRVTAEAGGRVAVNEDASESWTDYGQEQVFEAIPDVGFRFVCWLDDELTNAQRGERVLTLRADRPRKLRALFADASVEKIHYVPGDFASLDAALKSDDVVEGDTIKITLTPFASAHTLDATLNKEVVASVNKGVTIEGGAGPEDVVIDCGGKGGVVLSHELAKLTGVTLSNFCNTAMGPVLRVSAGMATNVLVTGSNSFKTKDSSTAVIYVGKGAELTDSKLMGLNYANWSVGNLLTISGGTMRRTLVQSPKTIATGIAVNSNGDRRGLVEDCTIASGWGWCNAIVAMSSSDMRRCVISGGTSAASAHAVSLNNSTASDTVFYGQYAEAKGDRPVVAVSGTSSMTNCLFRDNTTYSGPLIRLGATSTVLTMVNCTLSGNKSTAYEVGGIGGAAGTCRLINTILWDNKNLDGDDVPFASEVIDKLVSSNSCYLGAVEGDGRGNLNRNPLFADPASKDYSLQLASPCVDAGLDVPDLDYDLNGDARPLSGAGGTPARWDIGCYEREELTTPLKVELFVDGNRGIEPCAVPLSVVVTGTRRSGLVYDWKAMHYSGGTLHVETVTGNEPSFTFEGLMAGNYSFACTVSNDSGDVVSVTNENAFAVYPSVIHVSPNGSGEWPYDSPETATRDLWHALTNAGAKVVLHPGVYSAFPRKTDPETGFDCLGAISVGLEVAGSDNPFETVIDCGGMGGLVVNHPDAIVHGLTFTNFLTTAGCGHVLYVNNGVVSNVVIAGGVKATQNRSCLSVQLKGTVTDSLVTNVNMTAGTAASIVGGKVLRTRFVGNTGKATVSTSKAENGTRALVEGCAFVDNTPGATLFGLNHGRVRKTLVTGSVHSSGGLASVWGAEMVDCVVSNNSFSSAAVAPYTEGWVGDWNYLTNCLFAANRVTSGGIIGCDNVVHPNLRLQNCTIVDNVVASGVRGGVGCTGYSNLGGTMQIYNCIVWGNTAAGAAADVMMNPKNMTLTVKNSCFSEAGQLPETGNFAADPLFAANYEPKPSSPCVDAGLEVAGNVTDVLGRERPTDGNGDGVVAPDIGCYELPTFSAPLLVSLVVDGSLGAEPCDIAVSASVVGIRLNGLRYHWKAVRTLGDAKTVVELDTTEPSCVFTGQPTGSYDFTCTVTNDEGDEASDAVSGAFRVLPHTVYVATDGSDVWPYATPETACRDLWRAVDNAGTAVIVEPGVYTGFAHGVDEGTGRECLAAVSRPLRIEGAADPAQVVVDCDGLGGILVNDAGALVCGLTLTNFQTKAGSGSALYVNSGTVSNVVVAGGTELKVKTPSAVYLGVGATLVDSLVTNVANATSGADAAIALGGGTMRRTRVIGCSGLARMSLQPSGNGDRSVVEDCEIVDNGHSTTMITAKSSDLRRTLVKGNRMTAGNVITVYGSTLRDCVLRDNTTAGSVINNFTEGWVRSWSYLTNCLVVNNATTSGGAVSGSSVIAGAIQLDYCTVAGNSAESGYVGGIGGTGWNADNKLALSVRNSIVWGNVAGGKLADILLGGAYSEVTVNNSCFAEAAQVPDKGNIAADPLFRREYHIGPESPCCNTGMTLGWEKDGKDLDGNPRLFRRRVDMGCYECQIGPGLRILVR